MRVFVAIRALVKRHSCQLHQFRIGFVRLVALLALHAGVLASEGESCSEVIEVTHRLPVVEGMALRAIPAQLPVMYICVASSAVARKPEKRPVKVFHLDAGTL